MSATGYGDVDLSSPVDYEHEANAGLRCWLLGLPGVAGGRRWPDLTGTTTGATLVGGTSWEATPSGLAGLALDGSTGYATFASPLPAAPAAWTASGRATWATVAGNRTLISAAQTENSAGTWSWIVRSEGTGLAVYHQGTSAAAPSAGLTAGRQYHWCVAWDGATCAFYLDGKLVGAGALGASSQAFNRCNLGRQAADGGEFFSGSLASVRVSGVALGAGAVARAFESAQEVGRDYRLRRLPTRSPFVTAAGVPAASFVPAFAPGWGW